ncbi:hypothetical protein TSAR_007053 [Trichomalopsis sarcophagae]|uniref:Uncharacterized protein n=1 Tax=Trichomalopsis sarcophagae TaxID=543379 RepID=A0A232F387_9HYME|nr:hypothetical protein TSAR_007053 [Trichomalopsis sarcophagae]
MRLMQRLAISGLLSVMLIVLLTGTFVTRRDLTSVVDRGVGPEERNEQINPAWVQDNIVLDPEYQQQKLAFKAVTTPRSNVVVNVRHRHPPIEEPVLELEQPDAAQALGPYVVKQPNPALDDVTHQRREKVKEVRALLFVLSFFSLTGGCAIC